jgi:hypothetical protein
MNRTLKYLAAAAALCLLLFCTTNSRASEPGWINRVIAPPELRARLQATPIEQRPYRPLHFYGNTVRRIHYRGTPLPTVAETIALPVRIVVQR